jgi:hypothetical protein
MVLRGLTTCLDEARIVDAVKVFEVLCRLHHADADFCTLSAVAFVEPLIEVMLVVELGADELEHRQKLAQSKWLERVLGMQQFARFQQAMTPAGDKALAVNSAAPPSMTAARVRVASETAPTRIGPQRLSAVPESQPSDVVAVPSPRRRSVTAMAHTHQLKGSDSV